MTQIKPQELARVVCPPAQRSGADPGDLQWPDASALGVTFALGIVVGAVSLRFRRR